MRTHTWLWGSIALLLVATALRLPAFGQVPPGLYHDEAINGLDALDVLRGGLRLYFPANNGREPLLIYLVALSMAAFGRSPFALRLPSLYVGLLTVATTAALGRTLFSRRVGLLGAAVLSLTLWHVHLSRTGFRAVLLPLFAALAIWKAAQAVKMRRRSHWTTAGVLFGLSAYTYTAARLMPVALCAFALCVSIARHRAQMDRPKLWNQLWPGIGLACLAGLITVAPLVGYAVWRPEIVFGRPGQVSVFDPAIHGGDPWGTLGAHVLRTLGMFFVRGDHIWRHNVPWRPVFDPVLGAMFAVGLLVVLGRLRRSASALFVLVWTAVMLLPTMLAEDAPHFLRGVGVLPVAVLLPALGLEWIGGAGQRVLSRHISQDAAPLLRKLLGAVQPALLSVPLVCGLGSTAWAYFGRYAGDPYAHYWFEDGAVALAGRINSFLGQGWDGEKMLHGRQGNGQVYLEPKLWEDWPQVRLLVAASEGVTVGTAGEPPSAAVAAFAWPYGAWKWAWGVLPTPCELVVDIGPLSQGDRDPQPHITYLAFYGAPTDSTAPVVARLSGGVEYLGATTALADDGLRVRLRWRATAQLSDDYTVFLHYLRDGERLAQADSRPAGGYYPTFEWRPGDVINDDHLLEHVHDPSARGVLRFGFWQPETGAALQLLDDAGNPVANWIEVPANG